MAQSFIRIVSGAYHRTPIPIANTADLRPTPNRIRETLFNWLTHFWGLEFTDKHVLDLFAGSGALGFEAASRGAAFVQMVEHNPTAVIALHQLRDKLDAHVIHIYAGDALIALKRINNSRFHLAMLDPPFNQGWLDRIWPLLLPVLAPGALVYAESEYLITAPTGFEILRSAKAGQVYYYLFHFSAL